MRITIRIIKLCSRYTRLSIVNLFQFPFEVIMKFIDLGFTVLFLYAFWYSIAKLGIIIQGWANSEILVLAGLGVISSSLSQLGFGFRDLEYDIIEGNLDRYIIRPIPVVFTLLAEKFFIFWFLFQGVAGVIMVLCAIANSELLHYNWIPAILILVFGTLTYQGIYASVSFLSFWLGKVDNVRSIIFSLNTAKKYPIDLFPRNVGFLLTWVLPVGLLASVPAQVLLNKTEKAWTLVALAFCLALIWFFIASTIWKIALRRYESTGS